MKLNFRELVTKLEKKEISPEEFHLEVKRFNDFANDLLVTIEHYSKLKNTFVLTNLIWTIQYCPSPKFTEVLCFLLENQPESSYLEAIIDALHDIKDEKSIQSLKKVLNHYEAGDDDFAFNRKVLWALERIGTKEAFDAVKTALDNENEIIREMAEEILERKSGNARGKD